MGDIPINTFDEQKKFFDQFEQKFQQAAKQLGIVEQLFELAGTIISLKFAGDSMVGTLTLALQHLRYSGEKPADVSIHLWDSKSSGVAMVHPPCSPASFTDRGDIWGFHDNRIRTAYHYYDYSVNTFDTEKGIGTFWVEDGKLLPAWSQAAPLRTHLHWIMERSGKQLMHAAAIGTEDGAVLVTGNGGVGKSSTALSGLRQGMRYLGDDYVVVSVAPEPTVYCLYSTAKIEADDLHFYPEFNRYIINPENMHQYKAVIKLDGKLSKLVEKSMPIRAVVTPRRMDDESTKLAPIPLGNLLRAATFSTMCQLPGASDHTEKLIQKLCEILPKRELQLGSERRFVPEVLIDFLTRKEQLLQEANQLRETDFKAESLIQSKPLISVIIPVFNGEKFIHEAVKSVLSQNYPSLELIIIDDGSTDGTKQVIQQLDADIRYFYKENGGPASARNRGILESSADYIAFLDVDDLWPKGTLHLLMNKILESSELDAIRGWAQLLHKNSISGEYEKEGSPIDTYPNYIGETLYKKQAFEKNGLFDMRMNYSEDDDWFQRAKENNLNLKRLDEVTLLVRRHGENMTEDKSKVEYGQLLAFKNLLDRRRALEM